MLMWLEPSVSSGRQLTLPSLPTVLHRLLNAWDMITLLQASTYVNAIPYEAVKFPSNIRDKKITVCL